MTIDPTEPQPGYSDYPFEPPPYGAPASGAPATGGPTSSYPGPAPGYAYPQPGYGYPPQAAFGPGIVGVPSYGFDPYGRPLSDKSKVVAGILGILLGGFGVARFYIGDNRTAILQIIVTVVTCGIGHFWGVIDGILILVNGGVDAQGRVLRD